MAKLNEVILLLQHIPMMWMCS